MELSRRGFLKGMTALSSMAALTDFGTIAHAVEKASGGFKGLTKIADGVYSYVDEKNPTPARSFGANAGIIIGKDGVVVVDTLRGRLTIERYVAQPAYADRLIYSLTATRKRDSLVVRGMYRHESFQTTPVTEK